MNLMELISEVNFIQQQSHRALVSDFCSTYQDLGDEQVCTKMKQIVFGIRKMGAKEQKLFDQFIAMFQLRNSSVGESLYWFMKVFKFQYGCFRERQKVMERDDYDALSYFVKVDQLAKENISDVTKGLYWQLLMKGQKIVKNSSFEQWESKIIKKEKFMNLLIFNNAVCYFQLEMYEQGLHCIKILEKEIQKQGKIFKQSVETLRKTILLKMGKNLPKNHGSSRAKTENKQFFFSIISKSKQQFKEYIETLKMRKSNISISNVYNIALLCKKYEFYQEGIIILEELLSHFNVVHWSKNFKAKCYVLLSQLFTFTENYEKVVDNLNRIETEEQTERKEVRVRIWEARKKLKIMNALTTCPILSLNTQRKFKMLENIQNQLFQLTETPQHRKNKKSSVESRKTTIYQHLSKRKSSGNLISSRKFVKTPKIVEPVETENPQLKRKKTKDLKKTVRFNFKKQKSPEEQALEILQNCEEKIVGAILDQNKEQTKAEIKNSLIKLESECQKLSPKTILKFQLKCSNWYQQISQQLQAIALLCSILPKDRQSRDAKLQILHKLRQIYEFLNDEKNIVAVNMSLIDIGDHDSYDRLGEHYIIKQNIGEAIKYYEHFHYGTQTLYSQLKLAHAYSKSCTHSKKAINILNNILFQNKTNCVFKHFDSSQVDEIQNATLLLASIYLNSKGIKKSQDICQNYLQQNFSSYPIYHMLGIIHMEYHNYGQAFEYFIDALKLKPDHMPSLIEVVNYVQVHCENKSQIIQIVRKAFAHHHRNWDLLLLLVEVVSGRKDLQFTGFGINIKGLIQCAIAIDDSCGDSNELIFEAEIIWNWAKEFIQKQNPKKRINYQKDQMTIFIRLGQINLQKGSYKQSEQYFMKVLMKLQENRQKTIKPRIDAIKLELRIMEKIIFLNLEQQKIDEVFKLFDESEKLAKDNYLIEMTNQIQDRRQYVYEMNNTT